MPVARRERSGRRARRRWSRAFAIRLGIAAYVVRHLGPWVLLVVAYSVAAGFLVRWEIQKTVFNVPDLSECIYGLYTQLFFEVSEPFPPTPFARVLYFVTPVVGGVLVARGLVDVGGTLFDEKTRIRVWSEIVSDTLSQHVIVVGLGHVGYRVLKELRALGEDIVAVERNGTDSFVDKVRAMDIAVHLGDARRDELLEKAGLARAKAIVCATNDDLTNLEVALDAKRINPAIRVVMRMFDQRLASKVGGALELDQSFSTSALAAPLIALQATQPGVRSAYRLDETVRVTAEIEVRKGRADTKVADLEAEAPCRVVAIQGQGQGAFVAGRANDLVRSGDRVVVDTAAGELEAVRMRLG